MPSWANTLSRALVSGTAASATSTLALALLARSEGRGALQPVNATSHWRHGRQAARLTGADLEHTALGYATHHAATVFWAVLFERVTGPGPVRPLRLVRNAVAVSAVAAAVDYTITPKRFTPGWEFVLSKRAMGLAYLAMAGGLAIGGSGRRR